MEMHTLTPADDHSVYFKSFIKSLVVKFNPIRIYCFASSTLLESTQSCFLTDKSVQKHDYHLLVVTDSITRIEHQVQEHATVHYKQGKITILCHGKSKIEEATNANSRFFVTVCTNAKLIYSNECFADFDFLDQFDPSESAIKAQKYYDHGLSLATGFLASVKECLANQQYNLSVFMAHQVTEQCTIALIRVYLAYRSDIHNIYRQLDLCNSFSTAPSALFLTGKPEDEKLFKIMLKSYNAVRYKDDFTVKQADAEQLFVRVSTFVTLTQIMCTDKIKDLARRVEAYTKTTTESEVSHV